MNAEQILKIVPDDILDQISYETGADNFVKKLKGKIVFKLFIYAVLNCKGISLRILEAIIASERFCFLFNNAERIRVKHSGIAARLANMDYGYFEKIFNYLINSKKIDQIFFAKTKINIRKIDSTIVTLSEKLLRLGVNNHGKKELKYSVEINQGIPVNILFFKDNKYASEDVALPELLKKDSLKNNLNIFIFDRGIQKKDTFVKLAKSKIYFVSRLTNQKYLVSSELALTSKELESKVAESKTPESKATKSASTLKLVSDQIINFKNSKELIDQNFRLITGEIDNKKMQFITNIDFLSALEITELYKSRWEIETFFKFIKQELNFSHLISRSENGIKSVMYLTMITAILLTIYKKKSSKVISWAVAKIKFLDELESQIMREWYKEIHREFKPSAL